MSDRATPDVVQQLVDASDGPTAWFDQLYVQAAAGRVEVPWDRPEPTAALVDWLGERTLDGVRTLVVGCGLGRDAEFLAGRGADVVAFDISPTAIATARARHPGSAVDYTAADVLDPPPAWEQGFDLVVESMTVQALPEPARSAATARIGGFVAPGGRLLVLAAARADDDPASDGPPWPLSQAELDAFGGDGLLAEDVAEHADPAYRAERRWRATFRRAPVPGAPAVPARLFHVVESDVWDEALGAGAYRWSTRGVTYVQEGFVHLSTSEQVAGTLGRFYADVDGALVLLVVDPSQVEADIRREDGFFHVYGPLPIAAVIDVLPIPRASDGTWVAPV